MVWSLVNSFIDAAEELLVVDALKGEAPTQKSLEQDSQRPVVSVLPAVLYFRDDFGGHLGGSPAENAQLFARRHADAETKIDDLGALGRIQQHIL